MNREMFELYKFLKESKVLHSDTLYSMTTETLSLIGNSLGDPSLSVQVYVQRWQWTTISLSIAVQL